MLRRQKGRLMLSMFLKLQTGLLCQIRLKNHIPEALQVHHTHSLPHIYGVCVCGGEDSLDDRVWKP